MKAAALRYAACGLHVFPCQPAGKAPLTARGLRDATTDRQQIIEWWDRHPKANVAIRTGAISNLLAVDVDGDDGHESMYRLEHVHGQLPATASVVTPGGGAHYWFRHPGGNVANSVSRVGLNIDIRADGGYVIAPPSVGSNGRRYEADNELPIAPMPDWLQRLIVTPTVTEKTPRTPVATWIELVTKGAPVGSRNDALTRLTGHLLSRDVNVVLVLELVRLVNGRSSPPLPDDEVTAIVDSVAGRELRKRTGGRR